ncbi:MAG TPA: hypothetical protein VMN56_19775 [Casimicrobiaceae bacterium]|nr:hypothetical protein [Casimicrobiaceae bacterium]
MANRVLAGVLCGGLLAGALDIVYAFVLTAMRSGSPLRMLQSIASGVLGPEAYQGGLPTALLGLALHLAILVVAAWIYLLAAQRAPTMQRHYVACGALFGVLVYLFMNFVVLPLSAVPFKLGYTPRVIVQGFVSHAILVGLPIAWCLRRFALRPAKAVAAV